MCLHVLPLALSPMFQFIEMHKLLWIWMFFFSFFLFFDKNIWTNRSTVRDAKEMQLFIKNLQQNEGLHPDLCALTSICLLLLFLFPICFSPLYFILNDYDVWPSSTIFFLSQTLPGNKFQQNTWHHGASISIGTQLTEFNQIRLSVLTLFNCRIINIYTWIFFHKGLAKVTVHLSPGSGERWNIFQLPSTVQLTLF